MEAFFCKIRRSVAMVSTIILKKGAIKWQRVYVFDHPLIQHKLTYIRDKYTGTKEFRELVDEVATLMAFEITRDMQLQDIEIETPVSLTKSKVLIRKENRGCSDSPRRNWNG